MRGTFGGHRGIAVWHFMLRWHAPHSIAGRVTGHFDFDGGDWALGIAALPVGGGRSVCESGGENFLYHFRIPDYDSAAKGIRQDFNHSAAQVLRAPGLPDSSRGDRLYAARVCDLLARVALVSHGRGCALCDEFRLRASVVSRAPLVAERGGTVLFFVAGCAEEVAPAQSCDSVGSGGPRAGISCGLPFSKPARAGGRDVSGRGGHSGDWLPAGDFCAAPAQDSPRLGIAHGSAGGAGSLLRGGSAVPHDASAPAGAVAAAAHLDCRTAIARGADSLLDFEHQACGLVGEDQLQPLSLAAAVRLRAAA